LAEKQSKPSNAPKAKKSSTASKKNVKKPDEKKRAEIKKYIQQKKRRKIAVLYVVSLFLILFYFVQGEKVWLVIHQYYWGLFGFLGIFVPILNIYSARQLRKKKLVYRLVFQIILYSITLLLFGATVFSFGSHGIELGDYLTELVECFGNGGKHIGAGIAGGLLGIFIAKIFGATGGGIISLMLFLLAFYNCLKVLFAGTMEKFGEVAVKKLAEMFEMRGLVREEEQKMKAVKRKEEAEDFERAMAERKAAAEKKKAERAEIKPDKKPESPKIEPQPQTQPKSQPKESLFVRLRQTPIYRPEFIKPKKKKKTSSPENAENAPAAEEIKKEIADDEVVFTEVPKQQENEDKKEGIKEEKKEEKKEEALPLNMDFVGGDVFDFTEKVNIDYSKVKDEKKPEEVPKKSEKKKKEKIIITVDDIKRHITTGEQLPLIRDNYLVPPFSLLEPQPKENEEDVSRELKNNAEKLVDTLKSFGVQTTVTHISRGPSVTRYELQPAAGVKISKITNLSDDIAMNLAATGVRIEAPIPGKSAVGIEVPNKNVSIVKMRSLVESREFQNAKSKLTVVLGVDITGKITLADLSKMPHLLIAGATGSGKSVCVNSMLVSLLYKASPDDVKLMLIDPKVVELGIYNGIPHLLVPVVTDPRKAAGALNWAVNEMLERYKTFAEYNVRDMHSYNRLVDKQNAGLDDTEVEVSERTFEEDEMLAQAKADIVNEEKPKEVHKLEKMCQIVIIIDELADLMMAAPNEVEESICRLAQMARAAGMHLVIATQRPSVDVITGLIKANVPSRIAFAVKSQIDSRTILDSGGAEKLLGKGDMLFSPIGTTKPVRVQGGFVDDDEVEKIVNFVKTNKVVEYDKNVIDEIEKNAVLDGKTKDNESADGDVDPMIEQAIECVVEAGQASTSLLQRRLRVGYARAGRLVDDMEKMGIVGPHQGAKPRDVLMTRQQFLERQLNTISNEQ